MKNDLETISEDYRLLWSKCTEEQKQKIYQLRENVRKNPAKYGLVVFEEAIMCLSKYNKIRELVSFPKETRLCLKKVKNILKRLSLNNFVLFRRHLGSMIFSCSFLILLDKLLKMC